MDKYLLQILKDTNTIIIPGLGALTVTNPKTGEMMFMSYLKYDDGSLSKYISEKENISENDAKNLVAKYVRELLLMLDKGENYNMFEFGRFSKTKGGEVEFENWDNYANADTKAIENDINNDDNIENPAKEEEVLPEIVTEPSVAASAVVLENFVESEDISIPEPEAVTPDEMPAVAFSEETSEINTDHVTEVETFDTNTEVNESSVEEEEILDNLTIAATPIVAVSLDELLEKSETEENDTMVVIPLENEKPENIDTNVDVKIDELPIDEVNHREVIATETPNENRVQKDNTYVPPVVPISATLIEAEQNAPNLAQPKEKEIKAKKKRGFAFWLLIVLIVLFVFGGLTTVLFYDKVKTFLPFLESKRIEVEKLKDSTSSADELNEEAAALEAAENERIAQENQSESQTEETPAAQEVIAVEKPEPIEKAGNSIDGSKPYHVIGGAFMDKNNADRYAEKLRSSGNNSVIVGQFDGLHLVSIDSYDSKAAAQSALNGFGSITEKAWVFKWP